MENGDKYIRWFRDLGIADVPSVGGKNASLGEMFRELSGQGVRVPNGFAITAAAYRTTLERCGAWQRLHGVLDGSTSAPAGISRRARRRHVTSYTGPRCPPSSKRRYGVPGASWASSMGSG